MRKVLERDPKAPDALHILGLLAARAGRAKYAESLLRRCITAAPADADAHNNLGNILLADGRHLAAESAYARAVQLAPRYPVPHYNRGRVLHALGRLAEAEAAYRHALALAPSYVDAQINLANLLREAAAYTEAEAIYAGLLDRYPQQQEVRLNLGNLYRLTGALERASDQYNLLLEAVPGHVRALLSLALVRVAQHELSQARALIDEAERSGDPPAYELLAARAALYQGQGDKSAALAASAEALEAGADRPEYFVNLAGLLAQYRQRGQALELLERSYALYGDRPRALLGLLVWNQRHLCDWRRLGERTALLESRIRAAATGTMSPFSAFSLPGLDLPDLLQVARAEGERYGSWMQRASAFSPRAERTSRDRLRIGYLSADFREHPSARLGAAVFELHARSRFEVHAYAMGEPDDSAIRRRLIRGFDHFTEVGGLGHEAAARQIADDGIDILVDLQGYTNGSRTEIMAMRPAPVQVNWLAFPGTMGVPFIDYIVVDPVVLPPSQARLFR